MKIYLPNTNYACYVYQNEGVIRAYETMPYVGGNSNYHDYYIHDDYYFKTGNQSFSQYYGVPTCIDTSYITDNVFYRLDFDKILIIFLILSIFSFYIPIKIFSRLFRRFL